MHRTLLQAALAAALCTQLIAQAAVQERSSTLTDQQSVAVTIYNENLALVKDVRRIALDRAEAEGRRVRPVREPGGLAPGHADAQGHRARVQEGRCRQRLVRG